MIHDDLTTIIVGSDNCISALPAPLATLTGTLRRLHIAGAWLRLVRRVAFIRSAATTRLVLLHGLSEPLDRSSPEACRG